MKTLSMTLALLVMASPAAAQPASKPQADTQSRTAAEPQPLPPPGEGFTYQPEGRRDPFLNLLASGSDTRLTTQDRPAGSAGLSTAELAVTGIVNSRGALMAVVQGPDKKTHLVRQGDKLLDGTIKAVTPEGLIIVQDVTDPLSLVKQREVRRLLRSREDGTK